MRNGDPNVVIQAMQAGACGVESGAQALGFNPGESEKAKQDHADRLARIAAAQGLKLRRGTGQQSNSDSDQSNGSGDGDQPGGGQGGGGTQEAPGARGVSDLAADQDEGANEKVESRDTTLSASLAEPTRGKGKKIG